MIRSTKKGSKWTDEEEKELATLLLKHGVDWSTISSYHSRQSSASALKARFERAKPPSVLANVRLQLDQAAAAESRHRRYDERHEQAAELRRHRAAVKLQRAWAAQQHRIRRKAREAACDEKQVADYRQWLADVVRKRKFSLAELHSETVSTARVIKAMQGWEGLWPALRELLQNTIDHLHLLGADGRLHGAVRLEHHALAHGVHRLCFVFGDEAVCAITVRDDELTIEQANTFPIHPRALDTGVQDASKQGGHAAGGFGDGFKTAAIALLAKGGAMNWLFEAEGRRIEWDFVGEDKKAVGVLSADKVLKVNIHVSELCSPASGALASAPYRMITSVRVPGIGVEFRSSTMRRLQVFWELREDGLLREPLVGTRNPVANLLADACDQPLIAGSCEPAAKKTGKKGGSGGALRKAPVASGCRGVRPEPGVYINGIWVMKPPLAGVLLCFDAKSGINVSSRDRNSVADEDIRSGVMRVLDTCANVALRRELLAPLMGDRPPAPPSPPGLTRSASVRSEPDVVIDVSGGGALSPLAAPPPKANHSWLLRSMEWLNFLLTEQPKPFLKWLDVPDGAIFVSARDAAGADKLPPLLAFARRYLQEQGAPVLALQPGANRVLFNESSEVEVKWLVVRYLLRDKRSCASCCMPMPDQERLQLVRSVLTYLKDCRWAVHVHPAVNLSIVYLDRCTVQNGQSVLIVGTEALGRHLFVPSSACAVLDQVHLSDLLKKLDAHIGQKRAESYERLRNLMNAMADGAMRNRGVPMTRERLDDIFEHANQWGRETTQILENVPVVPKAEPPKEEAKEAVKRKEAPPLRAPLTSIAAGGENSPDIRHSKNGSKQKATEWSAPNNQIEQARVKAQNLQERIDDLGARGLLDDKDAAGGQKPILPASAFETEQAGTESCLKMRTDLQRTSVATALGGGTMYADEASAGLLCEGGLPAKAITGLVQGRQLYGVAKAFLEKTNPKLRVVLRNVVCEGYDPNGTYNGFCSQQQIIVNIPKFIPDAFSQGGSFQKAEVMPTLHALMYTIAHEVAHLLAPSEGHNSVWRHTQEALLQTAFVGLVRSVQFCDHGAVDCCTIKRAKLHSMCSECEADEHQAKGDAEVVCA